MKTDRLVDDPALPAVQTAFVRIFMPPRPPEKPEGVDVLVTARDRLHEPEVIRVAAFCAVWSLAAVLCFMPWGGHGWTIVPRALLCLALWLPCWVLALQGAVVLPGILSTVLVEQKTLREAEGRVLSVAMTLLMFSIAACMLVASSSLVCHIVGLVWLFALLLEGLLRLVLLASKLVK